MTHYADIRTAVKAIKIWAFEYLAKPINPDETLLTIRKALSRGADPESGEPRRGSYLRRATPL
jgi:two-component system response regulator HydG